MEILLNHSKKGISSLFVLLFIFSILILALPGSVKAAENRHQFVADVNNDTYGDAITFDSGTGDWWVAPAPGNGDPLFTAPSRWIHGFGVGSTRQFLADVTGDGRADAITFDAGSGDWWVAPAAITNDTFAAPSRWTSGHGVGSTNQMLGDINGDGMADAVVFFSNGSWWATKSNGTIFTAATQWFSAGFGVGSTRQFIGDVTADGKADAVVWNSTSADWWFAGSNGTAFVFGPNRWAAGVGLGSSDQYLADVTFDGRDDIVMSFPGSSSRYGGYWWVGISNGSGFNTATMWHSGFGHGVAAAIPGDVFADFEVDMVTYDGINGDWWVMQSTGSAFTSSSSSRWVHGFGVGT